MSIVQKLTEGIVNRDLSSEGAALINKWEQTGLLEGLGDDVVRNGMARLLENQAKELLRESSSMSVGDVEGFAAVAFPLVRRVFGSLIANDLVSVQPMSLPSGLIFFLDFTFGGVFQPGGQNEDPRLGNVFGKSIYGGDRVGSAITGGVDLAGLAGTDAGAPYNLRNGYASATGSARVAMTPIASGTINGASEVNTESAYWEVGGVQSSKAPVAQLNRILRADPDLVSGSRFSIVEVDMDGLQFNFDDLSAIALTASNATALSLIPRLSVLSKSMDLSTTSATEVILVTIASAASTPVELSGALGGTGAAWTPLTYPMTDAFNSVNSAVGAVVGAIAWPLENEVAIPEIDIKVDSVAVTAITKKLKAKWTPELGQDLNAYHNLDAEVELTQILSEQIALEIDREILEDLVSGAKAGTRYWSRAPGRFLNRQTGAVSAITQDFTGNVSEWYETLIETINDVSAQIHRKTLRGAANFVVTSPEVANLLEFTAGFRANVTSDSDRGDAGAVKVGSLSKKFDILVDPYFPRNLLLVGRRGSSFLESGYVYAPYVPLQTTPTIFGVEDFVPRKGVMTRYAKKMVRPDMYGLVIVEDLVQ